MTTSIAAIYYHRQVYIAFIAAAVLASTFFPGSTALAFSTTTTSSGSSARGSISITSSINMADDSNMISTYDDLAARALAATGIIVDRATTEPCGSHASADRARARPRRPKRWWSA